VARLRNLRTGEIVAEEVEKADTIWRRLAGLLTYGKIRTDQGMWFDNCWAIHTIGMRNRIDALFLAKDHRIIRIRYSVPPQRPAVFCAGAKVVVELGAASKPRDLLIGDRLTLEQA
jgi:uncharacterized protein